MVARMRLSTVAAAWPFGTFRGWEGEPRSGRATGEALLWAAGVPSRIRQVGQLSSSQPDLGEPHVGQFPESLAMPWSDTCSAGSSPNRRGCYKLIVPASA